MCVYTQAERVFCIFCFQVLTWLLNLQKTLKDQGKEVTPESITEFAWETLKAGKVRVYVYYMVLTRYICKYIYLFIYVFIYLDIIPRIHHWVCVGDTQGWQGAN